nr:hypothetical protein [Tanacetum cinerariifolium]
PSVTNEGTGVKPGVPDVTKVKSSKSEAEYLGNDEDDNNINNKKSDSEHETNENVSGFESNHQENKEEVEDDEEEEKEDEYVRTPSYYSPTDDEDKTNVDDNAKGD